MFSNGSEMNFNQTTVLAFFEPSKVSYEIPVYQRAYAWGENNWNEFLSDLYEQVDGENNYFFGNILLECVEKNKLYEIIDGQQRVTTITIFVRSLLNVLKTRNDLSEHDFDIDDTEEAFIRDKNIKLRPVEYDRSCYDCLIVENHDQFDTYSPSQKKLLEAKVYFTKQLSKLDTARLVSIQEKLENTDLTIIELEGKKDAALMFELENNRGKELTNMEKVKSYFMYQMYVNSPADDVDNNIEFVSNIFKRIYQVIYNIERINEDSVLIYHNNAYIKGYAYRTLDDLKEAFRNKDDKVTWIKEYVRSLNDSFVAIDKLQHEESLYAKRLFKLGIPAYIYPFIIKGYRYNSSDLPTLFRILEVITFRAKLINSRANIQDRLNEILLSYNGNNAVLSEKITSKLNDTWYWSDTNTKNYLHGGMYGNNVLSYLLWSYESYLQSLGYSVEGFKITNQQIEHIAPRTPTDGSTLETGYELNEQGEYSEDFSSKYLNCLGNLMLISGSHNASIGNKPFADKLISYRKNPILNQQAEIASFVKDSENPVWDCEAIDERHKKIVDFAITEWSFR